MVVGVVPGMVLVPAFLARIREIAATLLCLPAALPVLPNCLVESGLGFFKVLLAFGSIVGARWLNLLPIRPGGPGESSLRKDVNEELQAKMLREANEHSR